MIKYVNGEEVEMKQAEIDDYNASRLTEAEELEQKRKRMKLEGGDFHKGLALLKFDTTVRDVTDAEADAGDNLRAQVEAVINNNLSGRSKAEAKALMNHRGKFSRTNELLIQLATAIGMSETDIDTFFELSKTD